MRGLTDSLDIVCNLAWVPGQAYAYLQAMRDSSPSFMLSESRHRVTLMGLNHQDCRYFVLEGGEDHQALVTWKTSIFLYWKV